MGPHGGGGGTPAPLPPPSLPPPPVPPPPSGPPPAGPPPWQRIAVGTPGVEFEPRPPGEDAYDVPDTECDGWSTAEFTLRLASVRGAQHRYYRRPRQDAARAVPHGDSGAVAFAVADGVSSATRAERGAAEACRAALERILLQLAWSPAALDHRDVAGHAAERLHRLARARLHRADPSPAEVAGLYATTLVAGLVRPDPAGPVVELFRIGDSDAWLLDPHRGGYRPLFPSKTGADTLLVSNEVRPLPSVPDPLEQATVRLAPGQVLLVGTDGFGDPLGDGDGLVGTLFARQLATPPSPLWLAQVLDFSRETFDDDRTLLALWRRDPGAR
ncbi:protein phosphatase 2C domain-containing protein [Kitasatospora cineracea]|uniref:protein phosphatase 2C domain-containing protein n=1 Tax=Kitasatospora cineracea TaxID=88074 RepID=UPI00378AB5A9